MKQKPFYCNFSAALVAAMLVLLVSSCQHDSFVLNPKYNYSIVTGTGADSLTLKAASELEQYFLSITGKSLPLYDVTKPGNKIIFIGKSGLKNSTLLSEVSTLSRDGFIISSVRDTLVLAGNNGNADLHAVYTLLEEHAGCMRFTEKEEYVPAAPGIRVPG